MISSDSFCEAKSAEAEQELNKEPEKHPICIIVLGMAGSGKTTFVHKLTSYLTEYKKEIYTVNLDPAVYHVPYHTNIDIRDSVKFKEVMKQYGFGPNGAIMTSLNFFTSQFDRVINLINKNSSRVEYVIFDTPGQIEVFTWSASGTIITEALFSLQMHYFDTVDRLSSTRGLVFMLDCEQILYLAR
ncbi:unnamed protein product [Protopolystoma xenopodis]|uniref:GPN-loop GTPase n=1 Tax=Protopolystoma xenopodis TaxID=117903 RepID=A0A448WL21_9PLAT|nr:unnamed protein product [Protopolystoma xenopodis]